MKIYFTDKDELAVYVNDRLDNLKPDLPLTMTITRGSYGVYSVQTAIDELSADYGSDMETQQAKFFSATQVNI